MNLAHNGECSYGKKEDNSIKTITAIITINKNN